MFALLCPWDAALDTLVGIQGDGFVLLATDAVLHRSLVVMQNVRTKSHVPLALSHGFSADLVHKSSGPDHVSPIIAFTGSRQDTCCRKAQDASSGWPSIHGRCHQQHHQGIFTIIPGSCNWPVSESQVGQRVDITSWIVCRWKSE